MGDSQLLSLLLAEDRYVENMFWKRIASPSIVEIVSESEMSKGEVVASLDVEETVGTVDITSVSSDYVFHTKCNTNVAVILQNKVEVDGIVHDRIETDIHKNVISEKAVLRK